MQSTDASYKSSVAVPTNKDATNARCSSQLALLCPDWEIDDDTKPAVDRPEVFRRSSPTQSVLPDKRRLQHGHKPWMGIHRFEPVEVMGLARPFCPGRDARTAVEKVSCLSPPRRQQTRMMIRTAAGCIQCEHSSLRILMLKSSLSSASSWVLLVAFAIRAVFRSSETPGELLRAGRLDIEAGSPSDHILICTACGQFQTPTRLFAPRGLVNHGNKVKRNGPRSSTVTPEIPRVPRSFVPTLLAKKVATVDQCPPCQPFGPFVSVI